MATNANDNTNVLQQEIRKQLGSAAVKRFAESLPAFGVEKSIPDSFLSLLAELDAAESLRPDGRSGGEDHSTAV
ncbi:MAG: hypothetical protein KF810_08195 [Rhizobiaceae bacterium]|nr:hypothetical protein [Rhizobiaceae bacterium]